jgi:hypothetical protein
MFRGGLRSLLAGEFGALRAEGEAQRAAAARQLAEDQAREKVRFAVRQITKASFGVCKSCGMVDANASLPVVAILCRLSICIQCRLACYRLHGCTWRQRSGCGARGRQPTDEPARSARHSRMQRSRSVHADAVLMQVLIVGQYVGGSVCSAVPNSMRLSVALQAADGVAGPCF